MGPRCDPNRAAAKQLGDMVDRRHAGRAGDAPTGAGGGRRAAPPVATPPRSGRATHSRGLRALRVAVRAGEQVGARRLPDGIPSPVATSRRPDTDPVRGTVVT